MQQHTSQERTKEIIDFVNFSQSGKIEQLSFSKFKRCKICVNTEKIAKINDDGVCEECSAFDKSKHKVSYLKKSVNQDLLTELDHLLTNHAPKKQASYDAMLLFSGGKDSIYMLCKLKEQYSNLRILAVTVDDGFQSAIAMNNISQLLEKIGGVDHMMIKPKPNLFRTLIRQTIFELPPLKGHTIIDDFLGYLTFDICRNLAAQLNIGLVFAGLTLIQAKEYFNCSLMQSLKDSKSKMKFISEVAVKEIDDPDGLNHWWDGSKFEDDQIPKLVFPLSAWRTKDADIAKKIDKLNLFSEDIIHPLITCSEVYPLIITLDYLKFGYATITPMWSKMIREGIAERKYGLRFFESIEYALFEQKNFLNKTLINVLTKLKIEPKEVGINFLK